MISELQPYTTNETKLELAVTSAVGRTVGSWLKL